MTTLPRPDINTSVTTTSPTPPSEVHKKVEVTISRGSSSRKYEIEGSTESERIKEVVRQLTNDPYTAEWLP